MRRLLPILAIIPLVIAACGGTTGGGDQNVQVETTAKVVPDPTTVGKYDPNPVSVSVGKGVEWVFQDKDNLHSVTADDNSFDSGLLGDGKSWKHTFTKAGTFQYHCSIHDKMVGTITVK